MYSLTVNDEPNDMWKERVAVRSNLIFQHLRGEIEENHDISHSRKPIIGLIFEIGASKVGNNEIYAHL
jgi:hypothetical protein